MLSARAGTPIAEIETLLEKNNQELAFEPIDYGPLLGGAAERGHARRRDCQPIFPARAASRPAPRAIIFSAFTAVTGRGETIKSGGRVVKNVTGYDLCKLLAGSWGTLAAMTEVTIKVLPQAGDRGDRAGRGPRRRARLRCDGGRDGLVLRRVRRRASARSRRVLVRRICRRPEASTACGWRASRLPSRTARTRWPRCCKPSAPVALLDESSRARSGGASGTSMPFAMAQHASGRCGAFRPRPAAAMKLLAAHHAGARRCSTTGPAA